MTTMTNRTRASSDSRHTPQEQSRLLCGARLLVCVVATGAAAWLVSRGLRLLRRARARRQEWQGNMYTVGSPELVDAATALPAFPRYWRGQVRLYGINRFVKLVNVQQSPGSPTAWTEQRREPQPHST